MQGTEGAGRRGAAERQRLLHILAAATFLIFFQAFMIAPLLPALARIFSTQPTVVGLGVPAYLIPYGVMTLVWGPLSDRIGRRAIILGSMAAFVVCTAATALTDSAGTFIAARIITAVGASGVVPISLALLGDLFEFRERGRALGWLFGAMAGGMAVGSTAGALLEPVAGWQGLFLGVSGLGMIVFALLMRRGPLLGDRPTGKPRPLRVVARGYLALLSSFRARRTYAYVLINAVVHSGIFTWLGLYFVRHFGLGVGHGPGVVHQDAHPETVDGGSRRGIHLTWSVTSQVAASAAPPAASIALATISRRSVRRAATVDETLVAELALVRARLSDQVARRWGQADAGGGGGFAAHLTKDGVVVKVDALAEDLARLVPVPEGEEHAGPLVIDRARGMDDSKKAGPRP